MLKHLIVKNIESGERKIESDPSTVDDGQTKRKKPMRHATTTKLVMTSKRPHF